MVFYQYIISKEKEDKTMFKKNGLLKSPDSKPKKKYLLLFAVAFIGMMISFIPSMIVNKGIFSLLWRLQLTADDVLSALS